MSEARIAMIFAQAVDLPADQREDYVITAADGDKRIATAVANLLDADREAGRFMARPTIDPDADEAKAPALEPGDLVGDYRIEEKIGEGGYGAVYRAEQLEPVRRQVAFKLMKCGRDVGAMMARFEFEKQALARMEHTGIATVFDAGVTEDGHPYVAMELVDGQPITRFCKEGKLGSHARVKLFLRVCAAVRHAHGKGVIHRDLKPSNVLVTQRDGEALPVVIDFGIAAAEDSSAPSTRASRRFAGTPDYSSPEQTTGSADARSDVYSLGVLLHEMLTGELPVPDRMASSPLAPELRSILAKALAREWVERYESVGDLSNELAHYLRHEPVEAHSSRATYRVQKFVRRHRVGVALGIAILAALVSALCISGYGLLRAERDAEIARTEAARATAVSALLDEMLSSADPSLAKGPDFRLAQLLDEFDAELGAQLADQPEVEFSVRMTIGRAYHALGEYEKAQRHFVIAAELAQGSDGDPSPALAEALRGEGAALSALGRNGAALDALRRAHAMNVAGQGIDAAASVQSAASLVDALRSHDGMGEALQRARSIANSPGLDELSPSEAAQALNILGETFFAADDFDEADRVANRCLELVRNSYGERHPRSLRATVLRARLTHRQGDPAGARALFSQATEIARERLGNDHPTTAAILRTEAETLLDAGEFEASEGKFFTAVTLLAGRYGATHPELLGSMLGLVKAMLRQDRMDDAASFVESHIGVNLASYLRGEPVSIAKLPPAIRNIIEERRYADFVPLVDEVHEAAIEHLGPQHEITLAVVRLRAHLAQNLGDHSRAEELQLEALSGYRAKFGDEHPVVDDCAWNLAFLYQAIGRTEDAEALAERFPDGTRRSALAKGTYLRTVGSRLTTSGSFQAAFQPLKQSLEIVADVPEERIATLLHLAIAHKYCDADVEAQRVLDEALALARSTRSPRTAEIEAELAGRCLVRFDFERTRSLAETALQREPDTALRARLERLKEAAIERPEASLARMNPIPEDLPEEHQVKRRNTNIDLLTRSGDLDRADSELDVQERLTRRLHGADSPEHLWTKTLRGWIANWRGDAGELEADTQLSDALDAGLARFGPRDEFTFWTVLNYIVHLRSRARLDELVQRLAADAEERANLEWATGRTLFGRGEMWEFALGDPPSEWVQDIAPIGYNTRNLATSVTYSGTGEAGTIRLRKTFELTDPEPLLMWVTYAGTCRIALNGEPIELPPRDWPSSEFDHVYPAVVVIDAQILQPGDNVITAQLSPEPGGDGGQFFDAWLGAQ